jgi:hypothetical protein
MSTNSRPIVILESPFAGDVERNVAYARACMRDSILRGEAPYASHLLYTQPGVLDDTNPAERALGIGVGFEFRRVARKTVFYVDLGWSSGMRAGEAHAIANGHAIEHRMLADWRWPPLKPSGTLELEVI